jgi:hypothetical protein
MAKHSVNNHHVVPNSQNGGWAVRRAGSSRASGNFDTKKEAINFGRAISRNQKTELKIHNLNGRIAQSDSHGNDPFPPRG